MVKITIHIPDDKTQRVVKAMKELYPIPVNEESGERGPLFSDAQWAKEKVRRFIVETVQRYETKESVKKCVVERDDNIAVLE